MQSRLERGPGRGDVAPHQDAARERYFSRGRLRTLFDLEILVFILRSPSPKILQAGYHIYRQSEQKLFKKLSHEIGKAMVFFRTIYPTGALRRFVHWMTKYDKMFSSKCAQCHQTVKQDEFEPPLVRDFQDPHSVEFYHQECFPRYDRSL